jgi:hypothetical protein
MLNISGFLFWKYPGFNFQFRQHIIYSHYLINSKNQFTSCLIL